MTAITMSTRTTVPTVKLPTVKLQPQSPSSTAENRIKAALEHARRLTQMHGYQNVEVAIAWETVGEMRAAQLRVLSCQSAFNRYCMENPHARECRVYDC